MSRRVRVRFAPSPTGPLHIGGVRTALFNYLFAKKHDGDFILRIEDTDQTRFVEGAEEYIMNALEWCGISPTESPKHGGKYAPYRQSERKPDYAQYAMQLLEQDKAYYAFDTSEELEQMRERLKRAKVASPQYNAITRMQMKNSLTLPQDEVKARLASGEPYVIRIKVPRKEEIRFEDMIRGWVRVHSSAMDDKVLLKSDGMPTYHLANIVDDHLMDITHVIRGEEWLPSAPLHVLLYQYLGWADTMPQFAHLPLILRPDGNGKLSKRDGDRLGIPVFPLNWEDPQTGEKAAGFRESGYLPEAVINFLALLGWHPGDNQEIFSLKELEEHFTIARINKSGSKFDVQKAQWTNQQYLRQIPDTQIADYILEKAKAQGISYPKDKAIRVAALMKERAVFMDDFWEQGKLFFFPPDAYDEKTAKKKWRTDVADVLLTFAAEIAKSTDNIEGEDAKAILAQIAQDAGLGIGKVMQPLRLALTGEGAGPDLMEVMAILGREEISKRLMQAADNLAVYAE